MASGDPMLSGKVSTRPRGCTVVFLTGGGTPAESLQGHGFADGAVQWLQIDAVLSSKYGGGGLTLRLYWRSTATSNAVIWRAKPRRLAAGVNPGSAYDYTSGAGTVTTTVAGSAGALTLSSITFANGAAMDSLAAGEPFVLMIGRNGGAGGDSMTARADLVAVELVET